MYQWHLITHNLHGFVTVTTRLKGLSVEFYSPAVTSVKKRPDCNGVRSTDKPLFPGYLFVRLDPEVVHPSTVSDIPGVKEFVKFGGPISVVPDDVIAALKQSLLLQTDEKVKSIEYRCVSATVFSAISDITLMASKVERQVAFFELLKSQSELIDSVSRPHSRIVSVIERPHINEKIR